MFMTLFRLALSGLLVVLSSPAWCQPTVNVPQSVQGAPGSDDYRNGMILLQGVERIKAGRHQEAVFMFLDRVAAIYEAQFKDTKGKVFSSRSLVETLLYTVETANKVPTTSVVVASPYWAYAYYLKGYALLELERPGEAKVQLDKALWLSPQNSQFLSELGHIHQVQKDHKSALATFTRAASAAQEFSPDEVRNKELARAWRGMAFSLVEMKNLDEAELLYRKCLALDPNDGVAARELLYVRQVRAKTIAK